MPAATRALLAATVVAAATLLVQLAVAWSDSAAICRDSGVMFACLDRWLLAAGLGSAGWLVAAAVGFRAARVRSPLLGVLVLLGVTVIAGPRIDEVVGLPDAGWPVLVGATAAAYVMVERRLTAADHG